MRVPVVGLAVIVAACSYTPRPLSTDPDAPPGSADAPGSDALSGTVDAPPPIDAMPGAPDAMMCPGSYNLDYGGHKYRVGHDTWYNAETSCEADGQHLIIIDDGGELLAADLVTLGDFWLGLTDHDNEGTFRWLTTGATQTSGWKSGEPNDNNNNEDCVAYVPGSGYNDDWCYNQHDYICECDFAPVMPLWCVTNTNTNCDECGDTCTGSDTCNTQQCN